MPSTPRVALPPAVPSRSGGASGPPQPILTKVVHTDPGMTVRLRGTVISLSGTVVGRGTRKSSITLAPMGGPLVRVALVKGEDARTTFERIRRSMPSGLGARRISEGRADRQSFEIVRLTDPGAVTDIDAIFVRATRPQSEAGAKVSLRELRAALKAAERDGLITPEERRALATRWAALFDGSSYAATPAAQKEYAKLRERLGLPSIPVR